MLKKRKNTKKEKIELSKIKIKISREDHYMIVF